MVLLLLAGLCSCNDMIISSLNWETINEFLCQINSTFPNKGYYIVFSPGGLQVTCYLVQLVIQSNKQRHLLCQNHD